MHKDGIHYFECACGGLPHLLKIGFVEWNDGEIGPELELNLCINHYGPWYKRVWRAVKYAFGMKDADYDCCLINNPKELQRLLILVTEAYEKSLVYYAKSGNVQTSET